MYDLCAVSSGLAQLELNINEDIGLCGPCLGVAQGCVGYCLLCKGTRRLWCPEERTTVEMIHAFKDGLGIVDSFGSITVNV